MRCSQMVCPSPANLCCRPESKIAFTHPVSGADFDGCRNLDGFVCPGAGLLELGEGFQLVEEAVALQSFGVVVVVFEPGYALPSSGMRQVASVMLTQLLALLADVRSKSIHGIRYTIELGTRLVAVLSLGRGG